MTLPRSEAWHHRATRGGPAVQLQAGGVLNCTVLHCTVLYCTAGGGGRGQGGVHPQVSRGENPQEGSQGSVPGNRSLTNLLYYLHCAV